MDFTVLKTAVAEQFARMQGHPLFKVDATNEELWDTYLGSFPEGSNPIYKERTHHDCSCCKQFIRNLGHVIAVVNGQVVTLWDIEVSDPNYQAVVDGMRALIVSKGIREPFFHYEKAIGTDHNNVQDDSGEIIRWDHFHCDLPREVIKPKDRIPTEISHISSSRAVFARAMEEISLEAYDTVLELIGQNSLYRGEEHKRVVTWLRNHKLAYDAIEDSYSREVYTWVTAVTSSQSDLRGRNTSIGTLLVDLSEGRELDAAVGAFEAMVAPANYKRPTALITKSMIQRAEKEVAELGFQDSLARRHAVAEDITVNNVLFANRNAVRKMKGENVFQELVQEQAVNPRSLSKVEEIGIEDFIANVLPNIERMELLVENRLENNLMSLVAPANPDSKNMLKWDNNFSWTYNGEIADSMKQRVKAAGGNVEGVLRFSIQWNAGSVHNACDYDAHCIEPSGHRIYFGNKRHEATSGVLDVDIIMPQKNVPAVENITWSQERKMLKGEYVFLVHAYAGRQGNEGFTAEFESNGEIHSYSYMQPISTGKYVEVLRGNWDGEEFKITSSLPSSTQSRLVWDVPTMQYRDVSMMMLSPNHWDGNQTGNKHFFFILEGCKQPGTIRGFFNEFLTEKLHAHRKVFEVLGSKMRVEESNDQLSGLGFSSTQRNHVFCRVSGSFTRNLKIIF